MQGIRAKNDKKIIHQNLHCGVALVRVIILRLINEGMWGKNIHGIYLQVNEDRYI